MKPNDSFNALQSCGLCDTGRGGMPLRRTTTNIGARYETGSMSQSVLLSGPVVVSCLTPCLGAQRNIVDSNISLAREVEILRRFIAKTAECLSIALGSFSWVRQKRTQACDFLISRIEYSTLGRLRYSGHERRVNDNSSRAKRPLKSPK